MTTNKITGGRATLIIIDDVGSPLMTEELARELAKIQDIDIGYASKLEGVISQLKLINRGPSVESIYKEPKQKAQWKSEVPRHKRGK